MDDVWFYALLFVIGVGAGFVGNFVSGGTSYAAIAGLIGLGLPLPLATATYQVGSIPARLAGLRAYGDDGQVLWHLSVRLSLVSAGAAVIGTTILVSIDETVVERGAGVLLLVFVWFLFRQRNLGTQQRQVTRRVQIAGYAAYFVTSIGATIFSAGLGMFIAPVYLALFGLTVTQLKGTDKLPGAVLAASASAVFFYHGVYDVPVLLAFVPGMLVGGAAGARPSLKVGNRWLRRGLAVGVVIVAIKQLAFA